MWQTGDLEDTQIEFETRRQILMLFHLNKNPENQFPLLAQVPHSLINMGRKKSSAGQLEAPPVKHLNVRFIKLPYKSPLSKCP